MCNYFLRILEANINIYSLSELIKCSLKVYTIFRIIYKIIVVGIEGVIIKPRWAPL